MKILVLFISVWHAGYKATVFFPSKSAAFLMIYVTGITLKLKNNTERRQIIKINILD